MAISNYSGIRSLLFEYSNNIWSPKSDQIEYRIPLFGTQLFRYSNNSNYSFKHWLVLANVKYIHQQPACSGCSDDATKLWENIDDDVIVIVDDEEETEQ